jgi:hypothetical protein
MDLVVNIVDAPPLQELEVCHSGFDVANKRCSEAAEWFDLS